MVKGLLFCLEQCFGPFTMSLVEGCSQTGLFRHLSNDVFRSPWIKKHISYDCHLFFENVPNWMEIYKMSKKNWENIFSFWEECIWKCCNKLPLLRREYLLPAVNGLTKSPKIFHITQRDSVNPSCLHRDQ